MKSRGGRQKLNTQKGKKKQGRKAEKYSMDRKEFIAWELRGKERKLIH